MSIAILAGCSSKPSPVAVAPTVLIGGAATPCAHLVKQLPGTINGLATRATRPPSPYTHAWGKPPVVLRCGVRRPAGIAGAQLVIVNGVRWFRQPVAGGVTWTALRPPDYVALSIPTSYQDQGSFLVDLAQPLKRSLP